MKFREFEVLRFSGWFLLRRRVLKYLSLVVSEFLEEMKVDSD